MADFDARGFIAHGVHEECHDGVAFVGAVDDFLL